MYCKAITFRGAPCIASCKPGSKYCNNHDKLPRTECPVCLEEVPHIHKLRCGHPLCVECFQRLQDDMCPLCRRVCNRNEMRIRLSELSDLLYDVNDMRSRASRDKNVVWEDARYTSNEYMCILTRIVDISCSFHSVVFRQPDFLPFITRRKDIIPSGLGDIPHCVRDFARLRRCVRRFHNSVGSFIQRTGLSPQRRTFHVPLPELLNPLVPPCHRWMMDEYRLRNRDFDEFEDRQSVHPLARNHLGYEWIPRP